MALSQSFGTIHELQIYIYHATYISTEVYEYDIKPNECRFEIDEQANNDVIKKNTFSPMFAYLHYRKLTFIHFKAYKKHIFFDSLASNMN